MAQTEMPKSLTRLAATSSWVESGLEAMSMTSAPPAWRVRTRLAVSAVTCRQADMRRPLRGFSRPNRSRTRARTGMSWSAHRRRFLPRGARSGLAMSEAAIRRTPGYRETGTPAGRGGPKSNRRYSDWRWSFQGASLLDPVPKLLVFRSDERVELVGKVA